MRQWFACLFGRHFFVNFETETDWVAADAAVWFGGEPDEPFTFCLYCGRSE